MRTLHRAMMGVMAVAILAAAVGVMHPWARSAEAQHGDSRQHGQAEDPQAHFAAMADMLSLTETQRATLSDPFMEAFAAMEDLHRLHEVIVGELTAEQTQTFADMVHQAMAGAMGGGMDHDEEHAEEHADHRDQRHQ